MNSICLRCVPIWSKGSMTCVSSVVGDNVRNLKTPGKFLKSSWFWFNTDIARIFAYHSKNWYKQQAGLNLSPILRVKHLLSTLTLAGPTAYARVLLILSWVPCSGSEGAQGTFASTQHKCQTSSEIPRPDLEDVHKNPLFSVCQAYQSGKITAWIRSWKPLLVSKGSDASVEHFPSVSWIPSAASHTTQAKQLYLLGYLRACSVSRGLPETWTARMSQNTCLSIVCLLSFAQNKCGFGGC